MTEERLRIGKVAEMTGTTPRTIRYYEEIGLLTAAKRKPGAHRLYEAADVERLTEVLRLKDLLGISLDEVKQLAAAEQARTLRRQEWRSGVEDPVRRREILEQGLDYVDRQLELVRDRRDEIAGLEAELTARRRRLTRYLREQVRAGGLSEGRRPGGLAVAWRRMDFSITDEQQDFVAAIRDFCARECGTAEQREKLTEGYSEAHNEGLYKQMAELGWLGLTIPEQYGGSGGTMLDACLFMEETSRGLAPIGGYATTLIVAGATRRFGSEGQKADVLGGIASGSVEAIAMTEPEAGSDVGSLTTKAERVNGGYVINGQKVFCSNAHISDHVLVVARTKQGEDKHQGLSMIFVPRDADGMEIQPIDTMGGRETNYIYFTDCEAPADALLGEADAGWMQLMAGLNVERLILAATMLGIAQRAFDDALAYAKERKQFGRPIGSFQALQHRFADLATELEAARLMTWWVASKTDQDPDKMLPREASMVKLYVTEVAKRVSLDGMQMMGGYGYSSEYDMERLVRQCLVSTIYGGTSEIQRNIIAKTLGL